MLVVNADDFGLTEGTNQAIIDAHLNGIVTSTSLLANGYAFDHAVDLARRNPSLGVGVHLTLTEGPPVSTDAALLLGPDGNLPLSNQPFVRALITGRLSRTAIRREFEAQVRKIIAAGITPTHIDGHKYIHLLPGITTIAAEIAHEYAIPVMRVPHRIGDSPSRVGRIPGILILATLGTLAYRPAKRAGLLMADQVIGFTDTGHLDKIAVQRLLLRNTPHPGLTELLCHPGYRTPQLSALAAQGYHWIDSYAFEAESAAVSEPLLRGQLEAAGWILRHFGQ